MKGSQGETTRTQQDDDSKTTLFSNPLFWSSDLDASRCGIHCAYNPSEVPKGSKHCELLGLDTTLELI